MPVFRPEMRQDKQSAQRVRVADGPAVNLGAYHGEGRLDLRTMYDEAHRHRFDATL